MQHSDRSPIRHTSVTLRSTTRFKLTSAVSLLSARGLRFSEQRLMRECLRLALQCWRGHGEKACRNRRYNRKMGIYLVVPFYTTEALRSVTSLRCHHSGVSLSSLMDFAVSCYLDRILECWLSEAYANRDPEDVKSWLEKSKKRIAISDFVITYAVQTEKHTRQVLSFSETMQFLPWPPALRVPWPLI